MTAGRRYLEVMSFNESLTMSETEYVDAAKAKDGKMFPKKPDAPWGKGDKLSTPQKDAKAKADTYPTEKLPDGLVGQLQIAFALAGLSEPSPLATWQSPRYAYDKVVAVLATHGLMPAEEPEADAFGPESKSLKIKVCKHATQDYDQDSEPIATHTTIDLEWAAKQPNQFEVTAEVSGAEEPTPTDVEAGE